jgi:glycosyl hydrolase family 123
MQWKLLLALAGLPLVWSAVPPLPPADFTWWTTDALVKVRPYDPQPDGASKKATIKAARNEFEPFQVILRAENNDIDGIDVNIGDLKGPGSASIPKSSIFVYAERYLDVKTPSSVDGGTGEWPDALVPRVDSYAHEKRNAFPLRLTKGRNQPLWFDVYVPRSAPPGLYKGEIQVISGPNKFGIPLELEVWNFELPSTSSLITTFGFSGISALRQHYGKYTNDTDLYDLTYLYRKAGLLHRISLRAGFTFPPPVSMNNGHVQVNWTTFDRATAPFMDGQVLQANEPLSGAKLTAEGMHTSPALKTPEQQTEFWKEVAKHFRQKGWIDRLFNYLWDEPQKQDFPEMVQIGEVVRAADPDIKNLVTAPLRAEWRSFIDIWTPTINCFERRFWYVRDYCGVTVPRSGYDAELSDGKKLWWYQACGTHGCNIVGGDYFRDWPSYMIDHDSVRHRIMEWMSWKYDIEGELYYSTTEAYNKLDPWKDIYLFGGNGDGTLFYPGRPEVIGGTTNIPIESIRLKLIREGLEDYEYLVILQKRAGRAAASDYVDRIVRKTYDFDHDPVKLYAVRNAIGEQLSRPSN